MKAEPRKEHQWLQTLVGEWGYEAEMTMKPGGAPQRCQGTESVRSLGGLWIVGEARGEMPGGGFATSIVTIGFDPAKKRYVGTWVGSMMEYMFVYDGSLDDSGKVLTLATEGPSMSGGGKTAQYKDVMEIQGDDRRQLTSYVQSDDGNWQILMTMTFRRTK